MKKCTSCKQEKDIKEFTTKTGNITSRCKSCLASAQRDWINKNKDKVNERKRELYLLNITHCRELGKNAAKRFRENNPESKKRSSDKYKEKNKEKIRLANRNRARKDYENNPDKYKEIRESRKDYKKQYDKDNRDRINELSRVLAKKNGYKNQKEYFKNNPKKRSCYTTLSNAVRDGNIFKPDKCQCCGKKDKLEGHHDDYDKPLEVVWCCKSCHRVLDSARRLKEKNMEKQDGKYKERRK